MPEHRSPTANRRTFLGAAAVGGATLAAGTLSACGGPADPTTPTQSPAPAGTKLGQASDVQVGGARIYPDARVVVSQPHRGDFEGFSAVCTHQGCILSQVDGDTVVCPCHNSAFSIADGSVVRGPAKEPLPREDVHVKHGSLVVG